MIRALSPWLLALALLTGCGGPAPATFTDIYPLLFPLSTKAQCNFCHGLPANDKSNGNLAMGMDKAAAYAALVGKAAAGSACSGRQLVVPSEPDSSLLLAKVSGTPPCGERMPLGGSVLSAAQVEMVRSWIADGAKDD